MNRIVLILFGCCTISPFAFGQSSGNAAAGKKLVDEVALHPVPRSGRKRQQRHCERSEIDGGSEYSADIRPAAGVFHQEHAGLQERQTRLTTICRSLATQLSDDDIRDLAAWYGSQKPSSVATYYDDPSN